MGDLLCRVDEITFKIQQFHFFSLGIFIDFYKPYLMYNLWDMMQIKRRLHNS